MAIKRVICTPTNPASRTADQVVPEKGFPSICTPTNPASRTADQVVPEKGFPSIWLAQSSYLSPSRGESSGLRISHLKLHPPP